MRASDIRRGQAIIVDGKLYVVTNADHNTPGNLRAKVQFKMRDVGKGTIIDKRVGATDDIETTNLDTRDVEYLYSDNDGHVLMDLESFEQDTIPKEVFGDDIKYLKPNTQLKAHVPRGEDRQLRPAQDRRPEGDRHAAGHQGRDGDQPAEGRDAGDGAEHPRAPVHRDRRSDPDQHGDRGVHEPGVRMIR